MARPLRIDYPGAWHYVTNRGRKGSRAFATQADVEAFHKALKEAHARFDLEIHAYLIEQNNFHLLVQSPSANLARAMRHISSTVTQAHNRRHKLDGTLFRGRYKSILLEDGWHTLAVANYLHRQFRDSQFKDGQFRDKKYRISEANIEAKPKSSAASHGHALASRSSLPAYLGERNPEVFLQRELLLNWSGKIQRFSAYKKHLHDKEFTTLDATLQGKYWPTLLGSSAFKQQLSSQLKQATTENPYREPPQEKPCANTILSSVAKELSLPSAQLKQAQRGPKADNKGRHMAMLLCQTCGDMSLKDIAREFGVGHYASASNRIAKFKQSLNTDPALSRLLNKIRQNLEREHQAQLEGVSS